MDQLSDEELVERSRTGNMQAFGQLVTRHEKKVAAVVQSMLGSTAEAEDVGQEVFVRFYRSIDKFKGEASLRTYLIRIAINLSLNEVKRRKRRNFLFKPMEAGIQVKAQVADIDLNEIALYEVARLDANFRAVVTLRLIEGYSTEETAALLGIPLGTVLSRLSRAQKILKSAVANHLNL